jgi:hypothetical protein
MAYSKETMREWRESVDFFWKYIYNLVAEKLKEKDK